jgi:D-glycero-beta-D-manno-heptose-7-phosphate kinase
MGSELNTYLDKFENLPILVIGDVMLDKYILGDVERISPEAPVQVVTVKEERYTPGGAANVANNIVSLGGKAFLVGIVGEDSRQKFLFDELGKRKINFDGIFIDKEIVTIEKSRIIGRNQQLLRLDYETKNKISASTEKKILHFINAKIKHVKVIVISDYAKGLITKNLMKQTLTLSKKYDIPIIVDPKPVNMPYYKGVTLITPNNLEAEQMLSTFDKRKEDINKLGSLLQKKLHSSILITRGKDGISLFTDKITHIPTKAKQVFDVTGAGDTVVAALALAVASDASLEESAVIANYAAGIVVQKMGTSTLSVEELKEAINDDD